MTRTFFMIASMLALSGTAVAQAPSVTAAPAKNAVVAPAPTTSAMFGCDARAPNVCRFRIFYTRGDRIVVLPGGMKNKVPGVTIGGYYCMTVGSTPKYKCTRKSINATYNS